MLVVSATPLPPAPTHFVLGTSLLEPLMPLHDAHVSPAGAPGMLTKGGADVTIVDIWPEHVMHMKEKGLTVKCAWANKNLGDASYTVPVGDRLRG